MHGRDGLIAVSKGSALRSRLGEAVADDGEQQAERHDGKRRAKDHGP